MALPDACPLCQAGRDSQTVVTAHVYGSLEGGHAFYNCSSCQVRYLYPQLTPEDEKRFYVAEFEGFMASRAGMQGGWRKAEAHIAANEPTRLRRMKYLEPHLGVGTDLLEVGCSSGFMVFPLVDRGYRFTGIEPSGVFSEYVKSRGLAVYESMEKLKEAEPQKLFDLIMHFFVLEHVSRPLDFLEAQLNALKPGGKIIFEIPNAADPLYSIYDIPAFERFYWSVAHPWYFNEASLHHLLKQLGRPYEILLDQRYDLSNHMTWARDGKPGGMGRFTETLGAELEEDYKNALIRIGRCDTLVGVISKN